MIIRDRKNVEALLEPSALRAIVQEHLEGTARLDRLFDYYQGRHDIDRRVRAPGLPNSRLIHAYPRYISTVATGYLIGQPVRYEAQEEQKAALAEVLRHYERCAVDSVDAELARTASICGRAVERVFADDEAKPRTAALDPRRAFVVYDNSVESKPLLGVYLSPKLRTDGSIGSWTLEVCTDREMLTYRASAPGDVGRLEKRVPHYFGGVPMVETWNGEDESGDFECVLTLIDAYDRLQSDRMNDKSQFVDALLLLYGCTMEIDERGRTPGQQLREDKVLAMPDSDAKAEWLCKELNEADTEVLKCALAGDIHKLSMVPDLTDEHFGGNQSGVAMRYKLMGLEQLTRVKERWFKEALRQRMKLFANFVALKGAPKLDADQVQMIFNHTLPGAEE